MKFYEFLKNFLNCTFFISARQVFILLSIYVKKKSIFAMALKVYRCFLTFSDHTETFLESLKSNFNIEYFDKNYLAWYISQFYLHERSDFFTILKMKFKNARMEAMRCIVLNVLETGNFGAGWKTSVSTNHKFATAVKIALVARKLFNAIPEIRAILNFY